MTKTTASSDENDAINASIEQLLAHLPEDFRHLAEEFQRQSSFYQSLVQKADQNGQLGQITDLWNLPQSHGFSGHDRLDLENPWFQSLFTLSKTSDPFGFKMVEQWSQELQTFNVEAHKEVMAFHAASQALSNLHQLVAERAQDLFQERLPSLNKEDPDELCQAWLKAGEQAFQEISQGDEFLDNQAALFNSLSRLKTLQSKLSNRFSSSFGLPHQGELDALRQGLHELRMTFAEYREQSTQEIKALQQQLKKQPTRKRTPK